MGTTTEISWTQRTWNPWRGCTKVSAGCTNCYMFRDQKRYGRNPAEVVRTKTWRDPIKWERAASEAGNKYLVFTCSWSDWFHKDADPWREEAWEIVRSCPNLVFQILTKRADRIADHLPADWDSGYENVWVGVTIEDQEATWRISYLLAVPAAVRWISSEPLLGPVNFEPWIKHLDWIIAGAES